MLDQEQNLGKSPSNKRKSPFLSLVLLANLALAACGGYAPDPIATLLDPKSLTEEKEGTLTRLVDSRINPSGTGAYQRITFGFSENYANGTLLARICLYNKGSLAVMSQEMGEKPKWLLNKVSEFESGIPLYPSCSIKYVATGIHH